MNIKIIFIFSAVFLFSALNAFAQGSIIVTGSSSVSVVPDRITVEIGMKEYYKKISSTDSVVVDLEKIDKKVMEILNSANVPDSLITIVDIGDYYYGRTGDRFLMGKRIAATLFNIDQLQILADKLGIEGVNSFRISGTDNSNMEEYNRKGLAAAYEKAHEKATLLAKLAKGRIGIPLKIEEEGPLYYEEAMAVNTVLDGNARLAAKSMTMENMKKIVRRYNVKVEFSLIGL